jgi:glycosyltransferase involved in cell wall biosynthesis
MNYQTSHDEWLDKILAKLSSSLSPSEGIELDEHLHSCLMCAQIMRSYELFATHVIHITDNEPLPQIPSQMLALKREIAQKKLLEEELQANIARQRYPHISVVIPARNEAQNLHYVLPYIPNIVDEVILVDGHSTDDTIKIAQQLWPTIRIIQQVGRGKGNALRLGFAACRSDIIVTIEADGSTDPGEIQHFIDALLQGNDFAKGSRFLKGGGSHDITPLRSLGNYGLGILANIFFGTRHGDLCYGYNAFWKHCLDSIHVDYDGFEVEALISIRVQRAGLKVTEVPSIERPRLFGQSNLRTFRDGWRILKMMVKERFMKVPLLSSTNWSEISKTYSLEATKESEQLKTK